MRHLGLGVQFVQFLHSTVGVGAVRLRVHTLGQLRADSTTVNRARTHRLQGELHIGVAPVVVRQPIDIPGETEPPSSET